MKRKMFLAKLFACGMAALSVLAVLAVLAGCTKDLQSPGEDDPSGQGAVTRLGISAEGYVGDAGTKTSVKDKTVWWRDGDLVQVNANGYEVKVSGGNAYITASIMASLHIYAAYPAGVADGTFDWINFPSSYASTIDEGRQVIALPMMAYAENSKSNPATSLEFKHQTAAVKVMLRNATPAELTITRVVVKTDSYKLNGVLTLTDKTDPTHEYAPVTTSTESERQVEVTFPAYGATGALTIPAGDQSHSVQVPFRPIGADQMTIEVEATDGVRNITYSSKASNPALTRNKMMTARVKIDPSNASTTRSSVTLTSESGALTLYNGDIISGTGGANTHITIADGATVTLNGLTKKYFSSNEKDWAGITCEGSADIILEGTNEVWGSGNYYAGIFVPSGKALTIRGNGSLKAVCGSGMQGGFAAGIGANKDSSCGSIVIEGGSIEALGGQYSAAIGGCDQFGYYSCGDVTITSSVTQIIAHRTTNSYYHGTFIGKGTNGTAGTVTIDGHPMTVAEQNEPWNASLSFDHFNSTFTSYTDTQTWTLTHK